MEQEYNYEMIGICSHHSDYRLAWGINNQLNIQLYKSLNDYTVLNKKGECVSFHSMYHFKDEENLTEYLLIKNKNLGKFLIPENPDIDFFLFLIENHSWKTFELIEQLRNIPTVLATYAYEPEKILSAENLIFD